MAATTIKLHTETKDQLDKFREYKNESYDEVITKLVYIATNVSKNPELSADTINAIKKARARLKKGQFATEDQVAKRLGL